jgi:hypothetical protein
MSSDPAVKAVASSSNVGRWPLRSRRSRRGFFWSLLGIGVLVAIAALFALGPNKNAAPQVFSDDPVIVPAPQIKAPLTDEARRVAARFVQTAVAREHLAEAWSLVGPNLRGGLTREEWITGNNPVVPYPIDKLEVAPFKIDYSYTDSALLEIALIPRKGSGVRSLVFFLTLRKIGTEPSARWVVDNWVPRASVPMPK